MRNEWSETNGAPNNFKRIINKRQSKHSKVQQNANIKYSSTSDANTKKKEQKHKQKEEAGEEEELQQYEHTHKEICSSRSNHQT